MVRRATDAKNFIGWEIRYFFVGSRVVEVELIVLHSTQQMYGHWLSIILSSKATCRAVLTLPMARYTKYAIYLNFLHPSPVAAWRYDRLLLQHSRLAAARCPHKKFEKQRLLGDQECTNNELIKCKYQSFEYFSSLFKSSLTIIRKYRAQLQSEHLTSAACRTSGFSLMH